MDTGVVGSGVVIAPYEGSQRHPLVGHLHGDRVVIAPYEGSQPEPAAVSERPAEQVVIAPYEGSQQPVGTGGDPLGDARRHRSLRGIATRCLGGRHATAYRSSSLPTRDRNIAQFWGLLDLAAAHRLYPLMLLAGAGAGLRRGELAGLRGEDINLDTGQLTVNRQHKSVEYRVVVSEAKSDAGQRRTVMLGGPDPV